MDKLAAATANQLKDDIPEFKAGDTVEIDFRIIEGAKERIQKFKGIVIARKGSGVTETFTVRKISSGFGVERIFPLHSPKIKALRRLSIGRVRRAKLYYLRNLTGKAARIRSID